MFGGFGDDEEEDNFEGDQAFGMYEDEVEDLKCSGVDQARVQKLEQKI